MFAFRIAYSGFAGLNFVYLSTLSGRSLFRHFAVVQ